MKKKTHDGTFDLSFCSSGKFNLRISDELSGRTLITGEIDPESLALAMSGRANRPIQFSIYPASIAVVGKRRIVASASLDKAESEAMIAPWKWLKDEHPHKRELRAKWQEWALSSAVAILIEREPDRAAYHAEGWRISADGIGTQQHGNGWNVYLERFEDVPDIGPETPQDIIETF